MSEILQRTVQDVKEIAQEKGLVCVYPEPNELLLDLDNFTFVSELTATDLLYNGTAQDVLDTIGNNGMTIIDNLVTESEHGNVHVYLRMSIPVNVHERLTLQCALGSDPVKEALSLRRLMTGAEEAAACVLFETHQQYTRVVGWRGKTVRRSGAKTRKQKSIPFAIDVIDPDDVLF